MIEAADLGPGHVVSSHFSLGHVAFDDRMAAVGAAGFDGVGLLHRDYVHQTRELGREPAELIDVAARHGLRIVEIEATRGWAPGSTAEMQALGETCIEMAIEFGARHLTAVAAFDATPSEAAEAFGALCDRVAEHDVMVGLEPIPIQAAHDIETAREVVERAGRNNGGLCVDSWHLERGRWDWSQLEQLPPELITSVQINDGTLEPEHDDYIEDCLWNRRPCGDGEFDLGRFVRTLDEIGSTSPLCVEVISRELQQNDASEVADMLAATTRRTMASARNEV
ncbi:MAG: sugar phosphate isomerase/epimerase family protein [Acidimicrobiales bacterium]